MYYPAPRFLATLLTLVMLIVATGSVKAQNLLDRSPHGPLTEDQGARVAQYEALDWVKGLEVVKITNERLAARSLVFRSPDGETLHFRRSSARNLSDGASSWSGTRFHSGKSIDTEYLLLHASEDGISGRIRGNAHDYLIRPLGNSLHAFITVDHTTLPQDHDPNLDAGLSSAQKAAPANEIAYVPTGQDDGSTIRVMFAYTANALSKVSSMSSTVGTIINEMNMANPHGSVEFELATTVQVAYSDYADLQNLLWATHTLTVAGDGVMDEVHSLRDDWAADVVVLLGDWGQIACGHSDGYGAGPSTAFTSVDIQCAVGNYSVVHEVGHLMGAYHEAGGNGWRTAPFGDTGFFDPVGSGSLAPFRTVTVNLSACPACQRIVFWSNPNIILVSVIPPWGGRFIGSAAAYNAAQIDSRTNAFANFRNCPEGRVPPYCVSEAFRVAATTWNPVPAPEPGEFQVSLDNYPEPFNPTTNISYSVKTRGMVTVDVYDTLGRTMDRLVHTVQDAGRHIARLDGTRWPSGLYVVRLQMGDLSISRTIHLVK